MTMTTQGLASQTPFFFFFLSTHDFDEITIWFFYESTDRSLTNHTISNNTRYIFHDRSEKKILWYLLVSKVSRLTVIRYFTGVSFFVFIISLHSYYDRFLGITQYILKISKIWIYMLDSWFGRRHYQQSRERNLETEFYCYIYCNINLFASFEHFRWSYITVRGRYFLCWPHQILCWPQVPYVQWYFQWRGSIHQRGGHFSG